MTLFAPPSFDDSLIAAGPARIADPAAAHASLLALTRDPRIEILQRVLGAGAHLHIVGGTVRDALLLSTAAEPARDLDLATAFTPEQMLVQLDSAAIRVIPTGLKHQTVTALPVPDLPAVEITTFRGPNLSPSGGVVLGSSIEEDLSYRDFTVNALAWSVESGTLIDPHDGASDLSAGLLRAVGEPEDRFREDPLRVLRAIRLAVEKELSVDRSTALAAVASRDLLRDVSIERVRDEFSKILVSPSPARGMRMLAAWELLLPINLPEVAAFLCFEQNKFHPFDLFEHTLAVLSGTAPDLTLRLAALFHDVAKPVTLTVSEEGDRHFYRHEAVGAVMTREILERLRYPHATVRDVSLLVETHMRALDAGPPGFRRLLRDVAELIDLWRALKEADASATTMDKNELRRQLAQYDLLMAEIKKGPPVSPLKNLAVNGGTLLRLGIPQSPLIGVLLRALHERVLDDPSLNTEEQLLALLPELRSELEKE